MCDKPKIFSNFVSNSDISADNLHIFAEMIRSLPIVLICPKSIVPERVAGFPIGSV